MRFESKRGSNEGKKKKKKAFQLRVLASKLYFCSTSKQSHFAQKLIKLHLTIQLIE